MVATRSNGERRTRGAQRTGRAARVVSSVLRATGEELSRVGYAALRVEEVAERAGVNKTTIYRRWPGKAELVADAIREYVGGQAPLPDTGSLRGDLIAYLADLASGRQSPEIRGILSTLTSRTEPTVEILARELRLAERGRRTELIQRGIERGELPKTVNAEILGDLFSAPVLRKILNLGEEVERSYIEYVVDITLAGAAAAAMR